MASTSASPRGTTDARRGSEGQTDGHRNADRRGAARGCSGGARRRAGGSERGALARGRGGGETRCAASRPGHRLRQGRDGRRPRGGGREDRQNRDPRAEEPGPPGSRPAARDRQIRQRCRRAAGHGRAHRQDRQRFQRTLDSGSLGGPVSVLSTYRVPGGFGVKVGATVAKGTLDEMTAQKGTLVWKFGGPGPVAQATVPAPRAAAMSSDARVATQSNVYDTANYNGRKVDFNVKDIDIKNLLGAIAEISKKNIIVADDVKGSVTIKLRNVPWDQALDIILKSKGLGREDVGNIIRVAPIETLRAEQKSAAEAFRNRQAAEPLKVRLIPVNYARAEQLTTQLKDTLSERGTVSVDTRTNTLIVKDVQDALLRAEGVVRNLDTQTPEVLIEARIVEAATSFARQAGIQWGGN